MGLLVTIVVEVVVFVLMIFIAGAVPMKSGSAKQIIQVGLACVLLLVVLLTVAGVVPSLHLGRG